MAGVYSVSQVNAYIKNMFAQDFALNRISVKGEVSNCKYHTSGHIYFTLKDGLGAMQAVMFASRRKGLTFHLEEGQQVVVKGSIEVYERDGRYQLYASEITLDGTGDLFRRFEKLRNELEEMGMFSPEYKTPIPKYAKTVGIVTASTGAAIRDIINISGRRNPYVQLVLCPALVQGAGAAPSIVRAIQTLDALHLDVLIVGRGGGSIEDLWAFNEESVARAIFACREDARVKMARQMEKKVSDLRHRLELVCSRMDGLSPLKKISGGYGFVTDADGKRVETVTGLQAGDTLTVRLPDGRVEAEIREVYQENLPG